MAPLRPTNGLRYPPIPNDGDRPRRPDGIPNMHFSNSRPLFSSAAPSPPSLHMGVSGRSMTSKIPQSPDQPSTSTRRPPLRQPGLSRPPLTHQTHQTYQAHQAHQSQTRGPSIDSQTSSWSSSTTASSLRLPRTTRANSASTTSSSMSTPHTSASGPPRIASTLHRRPSNLTRVTPSAPVTNSHPARFRNTSKDGISSSSSSSSAAPRVQTPLFYDRSLSSDPAEVRTARRLEVANAHPVPIYPELDRYHHVLRSPSTGSALDGHGGARQHPDDLFRLATEDLPAPPTPYISGASSQVSGSPSTRFSESPGPGCYSRNTTPTSISSYSPNMVATARMPSLPRPWQVSRTRASSVGKDIPSSSSGGSTAGPSSNGTFTHALAAIRESINSSSSSSNGHSRMNSSKDEKSKKKRLSIVPPSPPPRKSSQKLRKTSNYTASPTKTPPPSASVPKVSAPSAKLQSTTSKTSSMERIPSRTAPPSRSSRDEPQPHLFHLPALQASVHSKRASISLVASLHHGSRKSSVSSIATSIAALDASSSSRRPVSRDLTKARTPSPGVTTFRSRFNLFSHRAKNASSTDASATMTAAAAAEQKEKEKQLKKGPTAGTGHEGYGRLGANKRRSSSMSLLTRIPPSPKGSIGKPHSQDHDQFLLERLSPVIIAGGEIKENRNTSLDLTRTDSNATNDSFHPATHTFRSDSQSTTSREGRPMLWPSAMSRDDRLAAPSRSGSRRPSESSDSEAGRTTPSIPPRSIYRPQMPSQSGAHLPAPVAVGQASIGTSSSANSVDMTFLSDDSTADSRSVIGRSRKGSTVSSVNLPLKLSKPTKTLRKWNMFSRSQNPPDIAKSSLKSASTVTVTLEAIVPASKKKPVAFYTMLDSSEQEDGDPDIEDILRGADVITKVPSGSSKRSMELPVAEDVPTPTLGQLAAALRMDSSPESSPSQHNRVHFTPRLQVHSPEDTPVAAVTPNPPAECSGRPSRLQQVGRIPKVCSTRRDQTASRSFSRPFNPVNLSELTPDNALGVMNPAKESPGSIGEGNNAMFLAFPPRHNSGSTCHTTSQSSTFTFAESTAIVPDPSAPLAEDEIWDEYDDLLNDKMMKFSLATEPPKSTTSRQPKRVETPAEKMTTDEAVYESPILVLHPEPVSIAQTIHGAALKCKIPPPSGQLPPTPSPAPAAKESSSMEKKAPAAKRKSNSSQQSDHRQGHSSEGSMQSQVSEDESPAAQVNLRVGSMSISKWLSFGHILFSPARDDMIPAASPPNEHSVLVIDGLGNDDWSFYAAETYPSATFFNLSPRAPPPVDREASSTSYLLLSPSNHHQVQYLSHADKFPFAADTFTTVVYRFPTAAPAGYYRNIISESCRVLKPGGYMELSILDLDMNNMGPRTRRAIRRLKERIHAQAPSVHLGSTSDVILRLLGSKGYTDIKTCRVGVPVMSTARKPGDAAGAPGHKKDNRSLAEMMTDKSPTADESITNMVAKVCRWWHGRCYGDATAAAANGVNMWRNRALLAECEEWRTNMKLMVCCARVPDVKRVVSI